MVTNAPHEVHQYEQVKYFDETEWECRQIEISNQIGCIECYNPGEVGAEGLVVEVKAMYKREDLRIKDESINKPRKHCIWPERGSFYTCFNSNLVIEPDTDWLNGDGNDYSDKPIYDENGVEGGTQCLPGNIVADLPNPGLGNYF